VLVWNKGVFDFSAHYLESLEEVLEQADFAAVVLTADDQTEVRKQSVKLPRDNVNFELGLFIGGLGRERCFFFHRWRIMNAHRLGPIRNRTRYLLLTRP
jgi:predicted nucleotide-binding protein